jgi:predicted HTH domain antitoxin
MANTSTVCIEYPDELRVSLKYKEDEFADEIKKISVIKLYELGKISSGMAAKVLDISRVDFIELLGKYKVSIFPYEDKEELLEDLKNAEDGKRKADCMGI